MSVRSWWFRKFRSIDEKELFSYGTALLRSAADSVMLYAGQPMKKFVPFGGK